MQFRNTSTPGSSDQCITVGEIRRGRGEKGKIDNDANCRALMLYEEPKQIYGLALSMVDQLHQPDNSCIAEINGAGQNHIACLPLTPNETNSGTHATFTPFAYCPHNSVVTPTLRKRDCVFVPSNSLQNCIGGILTSNEEIAAAAGKWMPIAQAGVVTHMAHIESVSTWREMAMLSGEPREKQPDTAVVWLALNCADAFEVICRFLDVRTEKKNEICDLKMTSIDTWRALDSIQTRKIKEDRILPTTVTNYPCTVKLKLSHLKEVYPPLPLPGYDSSKERELVVPFPTQICTTLELLSVEGSDVMGYNLHRGKQTGGNQTCMCPFCNATKKQIQKGKYKGQPGDRLSYDKWYRYFQTHGKVNPAQRANVHKAAIYVPKHSSPVPLHLMLGLTNMWRGHLKTLCQLLDGDSHKQMQKEKKRLTSAITKYKNNATTAKSNGLKSLYANAMCTVSELQTQLEMCEKNLEKGPAELAIQRYMDKELGINEAQFHGGKCVHANHNCRVMFACTCLS